MTETQTSGWTNDLFRFLAAYSGVIYIAGVAVISVPVVLAWGFDIFVPSSIRYVVVGASLTVMILAYVAERRARFPDSERTLDERKREYTTRTRALVGVAIIGLAFGIYTAIEVNLIVGGIFFVGAYFFTRMAFKETAGNEGP